MSHRRWAERVEDELARRGVPARFRGRLLAELRDHADDLMDEEGRTMTDDALNARLGDPAALAAGAAEEYRRARWTSRHSLLVFGLLPLPAVLLGFAAALVPLWLTAEAAAALFALDPEQLPRPVLVTFAYALAWGVRFVPFLLPTALFTRLYLRSRVSRWWFVLAAGQVLGAAGSFFSAIEYSDTPGQSRWMMGFAWAPVPLGDGWGLPLLNPLGWMQAAQVVVPAAIAGWMFRAARRGQVALAGQ